MVRYFIGVDTINKKHYMVAVKYFPIPFWTSLNKFWIMHVPVSLTFKLHLHLVEYGQQVAIDMKIIAILLIENMVRFMNILRAYTLYCYLAGVFPVTAFIG